MSSEWLIGTLLGLLNVGGWLIWRHHKQEEQRERLRAMMAYYRGLYEEVSDE